MRQLCEQLLSLFLKRVQTGPQLRHFLPQTSAFPNEHLTVLGQFLDLLLPKGKFRLRSPRGLLPQLAVQTREFTIAGLYLSLQCSDLLTQRDSLFLSRLQLQQRLLTLLPQAEDRPPLVPRARNCTGQQSHRQLRKP